MLLFSAQKKTIENHFKTVIYIGNWYVFRVNRMKHSQQFFCMGGMFIRERRTLTGSKAKRQSSNHMIQAQYP